MNLLSIFLPFILTFLLSHQQRIFSNDIQMLELEEIGSRHPSMDSLNGAPPDATHLHPDGQYSTRRSPSLR